MNTLIYAAPQAPTITTTIDADLFELWKEHTDVSGNTLKTYVKSLKQFEQWIIDNGITAPTYQDIKAYKEHLQNEGKATSTINIHLSAVKNFFSFLEDYNIYPDVAYKVKGIKDKTTTYKRDALTHTEVVELLNDIDRSTLQGKRDYAMIYLMLSAGLRTVEISRANIEDLTRSYGQDILRVQEKGHTGKDRSKKIAPAVKKAIIEYLNARTDELTPKSPLFISVSNFKTGSRLTTDSVSRTTRKYLKDIGAYRPHEVTAHSCRHYTAVHALEKGQSITDVQNTLGHRSPETTEKYTHYVERIKNNTELIVAADIEADLMKG